MHEPIVAWAGLVLLAVLCLPIPAVRKLVLELTAWSLRLAMLGLLGGAAYLWFRPAELPPAVLDTLSHWPWLLAALPEPRTPTFGIALAAIIVGALLPILAVFDACRKVPRHPDRGRPRDVEPAAETPSRPEVVRTPTRPPVGRAAAADVIAAAGTRAPNPPRR